VPSQFVGLDPVSYMRHSWGLAASAEQYGGRFFSNSANPSGVIEVAEDLDENEVLELARAWKQSHQAIAGAQLPAVLTGGATWKQMSVAPDNAQFLQTRDFQRLEVAGWFGVPLHRLGLQDRTTNSGNTIEDSEIWYVTNTLQAWLHRLESYFSLPAITPESITVKFNLQNRLRGNTLTRFQAYTLARNGGWMNNDEIRAREDLPPIPNGGGQDFWAPLNFAPVDKIKDGTAEFKALAAKCHVEIFGFRKLPNYREPQNFLPARYNMQSKLSADVAPGGENAFTFKVTSK